MDPQSESVKGSHAPQARVKRTRNVLFSDPSRTPLERDPSPVSFCEPWLASHRSYHAGAPRRPPNPGIPRPGRANPPDLPCIARIPAGPPSRKTAGRAPGLPAGRMPRPRRAVRRMSPAPGRLPSQPSPLQGGVPAPPRAASRAAPAGIPRAVRRPGVLRAVPRRPPPSGATAGIPGIVPSPLPAFRTPAAVPMAACRPRNLRPPERQPLSLLVHWFDSPLRARAHVRVQVYWRIRIHALRVIPMAGLRRSAPEGGRSPRTLRTRPVRPSALPPEAPRPVPAHSASGRGRRPMSGQGRCRTSCHRAAGPPWSAQNPSRPAARRPLLRPRDGPGPAPAADSPPSRPRKPSHSGRGVLRTRRNRRRGSSPTCLPMTTHGPSSAV